MSGLELLGDLVIGILIALAYLAAWVAWLTLGLLPFVVAGVGYLAVRFGVPFVAHAAGDFLLSSWRFVRGSVRRVRHLVPHHA